MSHEPKRLVFWRPPGSCLQVTARTWQAMSAALPADAKARMSVYTNDLYSNAGAAPLATCPLSPVYQAASARPATPSATPAPRSAERLQHQRIATPSRLQSEAGSPRGMQRLQQLPGLGLSTGNVPAAAPAPAALAQLQAEAEARPSTAPAPQLRTSTISLASLKHPAPAEAATQQEQQQGQQLLPAAVQHQAVRQRCSTGAFLLAARRRKGGPGGATYLLSVGPWPGRQCQGGMERSPVRPVGRAGGQQAAGVLPQCRGMPE